MVKVFISYSHDSDEHKGRVHALADRLLADGIAIILDKDCGPGGPAEGWVKWSEQTAANSQIVLVVFTESYRRCWDGSHSPGMRLGATHEAKIIHQRTYDAGQKTDFCRVVVFEESDRRHIPHALAGLHSFDATREGDYKELREWLRNVLSVPPPGPTRLPNEGTTSPAHQSVIDVEVERKSLFKPLLEFGRQRDIVFALGGVGSGLNTFIFQFNEYLKQNHVHNYTGADFDKEELGRIYKAREDACKTSALHSKISVRDHLELKCLLASLAYSSYHALHDAFASGVDGVVPSVCAEDPVVFTENYFARSDAMYRADLAPIVEHFFNTVQHIAEATSVDGVVVLMPWRELAKCFEARADNALKKMAIDLWDALGDFATRLAATSGKRTGAGGVNMYDKVCFVVAASEIPFGHRTFKTKLVPKSLWPLPPLSTDETTELLTSVCPHLADMQIAESLLEWTGGSPGLTRIALSFVQNALVQHGATAGSREGAERIFETSLKEAETILEAGGVGIAEPLHGFIGDYISRVRDALGEGQATDSVIETAWAGPSHKRTKGLESSQRIEAFIASGLVWFEGEPWNIGSNNYIFERYPTVKLRKASRLAMAVYKYVSGRSFGWSES